MTTVVMPSDMGQVDDGKRHGQRVDTSRVQHLKRLHAQQKNSGWVAFLWLEFLLFCIVLHQFELHFLVFQHRKFQLLHTQVSTPLGVHYYISYNLQPFFVKH